MWNLLAPTIRNPQIAIPKLQKKGIPRHIVRTQKGPDPQ